MNKKHLLVIEDPTSQRTINLQSTTCSIGRDKSNLIVLNFPRISRYHATLLRITIPGTINEQIYRIIDGDLIGRRSRNGFKVNGKVCLSYDLQNGDVINFGDGIKAKYQSMDTLTSPTLPQIYSHEQDIQNYQGDIDEDSFFEDDIGETHLFSKAEDIDCSQSFRRDTENITEEERQASIQQSLERLASFPELFSDPIIEIDLKGNITYLNPAALKRFPKLKKNKLQHPILAGIISLVKAKKQSSLVHEVKIGERIFEQSIHLISASKLVRCYISDITKRKKAELLLRKTHQELEKRVEQRTLELAQSNKILKAEIAERKQAEEEIRLLQTITRAITEAFSFDNAITITLRKVCETLGWSLGEAWIPHNQDNLLKLNTAHYHNREKPDFFRTNKLKSFREASLKFNFSKGSGLPGRVWSTKKIEWIKDVTQQAEKLFLRKEIAQATALQTALGVPIIASEEVIAVFVFFDFQARSENQGIVELVSSVASQLGLFMERKRAEDALRSSMATNRAILDAIPDLIFRISRKGILVNFKVAKEENVITPEKKFLGKHICEVFPQELALPTMDCIERVFASGEVQIVECQIPDNDKFYSYEVRLTVSEVDEVMAIVRDITERKQAEEDICRTLEQEKRLNELKGRFVTMASHEFRTPLASILSSAELLEHYSHKWSEDKKLNHLHRIQTSVNHMTELLNDVLILGKADAGKLKLNPRPINLLQFCRDLVQELQLTTQSHEIKFQIKNCSKADDSWSQKSGTTNDEVTTVCIDEKMLRHILSNLLSNAIKYSPDSDQVILKLSCQSSQAVIQVQDFGIGVPPSEQGQLFDSFHRCANVGDISGTGLGLPIVKRAVDLSGGTITVDSQVEVGTTFTVTLPYIVVETELDKYAISQS